MKLTGKTMTLDLGRDLPVTREDVEAQWEIKYRGEMTMEEYIDFLMEIGAFEVEDKERKFYDEVFEL